MPVKLFPKTCGEAQRKSKEPIQDKVSVKFHDFFPRSLMFFLELSKTGENWSRLFNAPSGQKKTGPGCKLKRQKACGKFCAHPFAVNRIEKKHPGCCLKKGLERQKNRWHLYVPHKK
ncbi:unnamed protein product [Discosporangium mesarthrocarpum]